MKRDTYNIQTNPTYVHDCRKSSPHMISRRVQVFAIHQKRCIQQTTETHIRARLPQVFAIALGVYMSFFTIHHFTTYDHIWQKIAAVTHACASVHALGVYKETYKSDLSIHM